MDTQTGGGVFARLRRSLSGGSFFITDFTSSRVADEVTFAPRFPGIIPAMTFAPSQSLVCRKETFLCAEETVGLDIVFPQRLGAGLFADEGFILQQVTGPGTVFLDPSGEVVEKMLAPGERLRVQAGHIEDPTVDTDIALVSRFRNAVLGCEGFFLATLTGPGRVWLQLAPGSGGSSAAARRARRSAGSSAASEAATSDPSKIEDPALLPATRAQCFARPPW